MTKKTYYEIPNIYLASVLVTLKYKIKKMKKREEQVFFMFLDSEFIRNDVANYFSGRIVLNPHKLFHNLKKIKIQINKRFK